MCQVTDLYLIRLPEILAEISKFFHITTKEDTEKQVVMNLGQSSQ